MLMATRPRHTRLRARAHAIPYRLLHRWDRGLLLLLLLLLLRPSVRPSVRPPPFDRPAGRMAPCAAATLVLANAGGAQPGWAEDRGMARGGGGAAVIICSRPWQN
jgi:hypothetical protein